MANSSVLYLQMFYIFFKLILMGAHSSCWNSPPPLLPTSLPSPTYQLTIVLLFRLLTLSETISLRMCAYLDVFRFIVGILAYIINTGTNKVLSHHVQWKRPRIYDERKCDLIISLMHNGNSRIMQIDTDVYGSNCILPLRYSQSSVLNSVKIIIIISVTNRNYYKQTHVHTHRTHSLSSDHNYGFVTERTQWARAHILVHCFGLFPYFA